MAGLWKPRTSVWVKKLKKDGVVQEEIRSGVYRVLVGSFVMECEEDDLKELPASLKKKNLKKNMVLRHDKPDYRNPDLRKKMAIDLHGKTVEDAIRELDTALSRALFEGYGSMEIVHGLGTGRVRKAVHAHLDKLKVASHYKLDDANPGITRVYFAS